MDMRKFLLSEEYGRNIIWVMLSGFFLKIGAKENFLGQIIMPKDHFLFNLNENEFNNNHLNYKHLHYILLDGSVEFLEDERLKKIKEKINIYYVGRLDNFWKSVEYSQPLFDDNLDKNLEIFEIAKKKYPIFFKKYLLKKTLITLNNLKKMKLSLNHFFGKKKYVYYGYIKPTKEHLIKFQNNLNIEYNQYRDIFELNNDIKNINYKIRYICDLKYRLIQKIDKTSYPYLNEFFLFMIRYIICSYLKNKENCLIYDGEGGKLNFNSYEMFFGNQHTYLDLGSKVGFDKIYPRQALLQFSNRNTVKFILDEDFIFKNSENCCDYMQKKITEFLNKLNIKL